MSKCYLKDKTIKLPYITLMHKQNFQFQFF